MGRIYLKWLLSTPPTSPVATTVYVTSWLVVSLVANVAIFVQFPAKTDAADAVSDIWSYEGLTGPVFWPEMFEGSCNGTLQSPINIITARTVYDPSLTPILFRDYNRVPQRMIIGNNGRTASLTLPTKAIAVGNSSRTSPSSLVVPRISRSNLNGTYLLAEIHFHWGGDNSIGSEHRIDGRAYPLEAHFVHYHVAHETISSAKVVADGLAVVAVFFELSRRDNPVLAPVVAALPQIRYRGLSTRLQKPFALESLLPMGVHTNYYRYAGSLTTPDCHESVHWTVVPQTLPISERQLNRFRLLQDIHIPHGVLDFSSTVDADPTILDNYRPPQPLNGRIVWRSVMNEEDESLLFGTPAEAVTADSGNGASRNPLIVQQQQKNNKLLSNHRLLRQSVQPLPPPPPPVIPRVILLNGDQYYIADDTVSAAMGSGSSHERLQRFVRRRQPAFDSPEPQIEALLHEDDLPPLPSPTPVQRPWYERRFEEDMLSARLIHGWRNDSISALRHEMKKGDRRVPATTFRYEPSSSSPSLKPVGNQMGCSWYFLPFAAFLYRAKSVLQV